jgi:hypothetical protein
VTGLPADRLALRRSLLAGALYDALLGTVVLLAGTALRRAMGAPVSDPFHFQLAALPLFLLPVLYLAAARAADPDPFRPAILWARGGGGACLLVLVAAHRPPAPWLYVVIGALDLGWALLHAALWRRR